MKRDKGTQSNMANMAARTSPQHIHFISFQSPVSVALAWPTEALEQDPSLFAPCLSDPRTESGQQMHWL